MPRRPHKAIILAAGFGTRLKPITDFYPKPLVPVGGITMLDRSLTMLREWGVTDVLINIHHHADAIRQHLHQRKSDGLKITLSFEPTITGTGGALRNAFWFFDDTPFWVVNADVIAKTNPLPIIKAIRKRNTIAAAWIYPQSGPRTCTLKNGRILSFRNPDPSHTDVGTFTGIHLIRPEITRFLSTKSFSSIIPAYERAMKAGWEIQGTTDPKSLWADAGTPVALLSAHKQFRTRRPSADCVIHPKAILNNTIVFPGTHLGPKAYTHNAIIASPHFINTSVDGIVVPYEPKRDKALDTALRKLDWPIDQTSIQRFTRNGSSRSFTRAIFKNQSVMIITYGTERKENECYASHATLLSSGGIPTPKSLYHNRKTRTMIMQDLGIRTLHHLFHHGSPKQTKTAYRRAISHIAHMHSTGLNLVKRKNVRLEPAFDKALFTWEQGFFVEKFAANTLHESAPLQRSLRKELASLTDPLLACPTVLIHRDLQSTNLIWHSGDVAMIDFQGMRSGPAAYDLASFLYDPYVKLTHAFRHELLQRYARHQDGRIIDVFLLDTAVVQRLCQAVGAYCRLSQEAGQPEFATHITPALQSIRAAIRRSRLDLPILQTIIESHLSK